MAKNLYVGNLQWGVTEQELRDLFSSYGNVYNIKLVKDYDTGKPKGFAFVGMKTDEEANNAMRNLQGREFKGRQLKINPAKKQS